MRNKLILTFLLGLSSTLYGQIPAGRYFQNIEGTVWLTETVIDTASVLSRNEFNLSILESDIDSMNSNSIFVIIDKNLTVKRYNADTKDRELIFQCSYNNNEEWHILSLIIDNQEVKYLYVPTATGGMVSFFEMKK